MILFSTPEGNVDAASIAGGGSSTTEVPTNPDGTQLDELKQSPGDGNTSDS